LLDKEDVETTRKYSKTIRALQDITESHRDMVLRSYTHVINYHSGLLEPQKEELRKVRVGVTRLLENTSIMLRRNKKVDYEYIANQRKRLEDSMQKYNKMQIHRIQQEESKTRLSILYYSFLQNCEKISEQTHNLLDIFKDYFEVQEQDASKPKID